MSLPTKFYFIMNFFYSWRECFSYEITCTSKTLKTTFFSS